MTSPSKAFHILKNMGPRYVLYRLKHEFDKRSGALVPRFPTNPPRKQFVTLEEWRNNAPPFFFESRETLGVKKRKAAKLKTTAHRILQGELLFFSSSWKDLGKDYDWITNPENGYQYDVSQHWSKINDYSKKAGDIKYVWEKSRFTFFQTILRYDHHYAEDHSEWVFGQMDDWIKANPLNQGPNYRCSQEISLRIINWCFALYFYKHSRSLGEERWQAYLNSIYWQLHHVFKHINFSKIAVRNNHAITETGMLAISHLLFPFFPGSEKWSRLGRVWLEKEVDYQVYNDGTFLQFSMNYNRVVVQLLTLFLRLSELHGQKLSSKTYDKAYKTLEFLYSCQEIRSGKLPNYGANDGALFFNWSNADFLDYRPSLNALHSLLTHQDLYSDEYDEWREETQWWGGQPSDSSYAPLVPVTGIKHFKDGGYFVIREEESLLFLRAGGHRDRPSQADNLHFDAWIGEVNIARDAGSYLYNTSEKMLRYFMGTASHNTVMIGDYDQMLKGGRFMWYYWSDLVYSTTEETQEYYSITAKVRVFKHLQGNITHKRRVLKWKNRLKWEIQDELENVPKSLMCHQLWHLEHEVLDRWTAYSGDQKVEPILKKDWFSRYYGTKQEGHSMIFPFRGSIKTIFEL